MSSENEQTSELKDQSAMDVGHPLPKLDTSTQLSMVRTTLALDRTTLAWIRTSLSLLGFGFVFSKYVHEILRVNPINGIHLDSPRNLGLIMMIFGVAGVLGGIIQYFRVHHGLRKYCSVSPWSPAIVMAIMMFLGGCVLTALIMLESKLQ